MTIESREFYEVMQTYRWAEDVPFRPLQPSALEALHAVIDFIEKYVEERCGERKKILQRMVELEDGLGVLLKACREIPITAVDEYFIRDYGVAAKALACRDRIDGRFVPRFGTCPAQNITATECIRAGNCTCGEKERRA